MVSDTVKEKIERFKELVKKGYSVSKARRESKLHPPQYKKYYDEIWSDPDMKPYMPQKKTENPQNSQSQASQKSEKPPTIEDADKHLAEYGVKTEENLKSQLERELDELELKRRSIVRAAEKALRLYGGTTLGTTTNGTGEKPKDIIAEFENAFKDFESKRARVKEILERLGFRVKDIYMRRDEVERIILSILFLGASI